MRRLAWSALGVVAAVGWLLVGASVAGALTFSQAAGSPFPSGDNAPSSVAVSDFNADGRRDLAVANWSGFSSGSVSVLVGTAAGGFRAAVGSPFDTGGSSPSGVAVGDFNGDGKRDVVVSNYGSSSVSVLLGNGRGGLSLAARPVATGGSYPVSVAVGDFNHDGKQDVAVANWFPNSVSVLLGDGAGGLTGAAGSPFATGESYAGSVTVGDFNADGRQDLAVVNTGPNNVSVLLGNGEGGFRAAVGSPFATRGKGSYEAAVGDFNGDGRLDLAVGNADSNNVSVLLGNGEGGLRPAAGSPFATGEHPVSVAVGDFNADGKLDLAVADQGLEVADWRTSKVSVLLGNGAGGMTAAAGSPFATGGLYPDSVAVADFNGDGKEDLAIANSGTEDVSVLLNRIATPEAMTGTASDLTLTGARLRGTVNPRDPDIAARYHFQYGTSTAYGRRVPATDAPVPSAAADHLVSQALAGLAPGTTYHYRLVASNVTGTSYGEDRTLTTQRLPVASVPGRVGTVGAALRFKFACKGAATQSCPGAVSATTVEILSADGRRIVGVSATPIKGRIRTVTVLHARFTAHGGHTIDVKRSLNATGRMLRTRFKKLPATVKVTATIAGHTTTIRTAKVTFGPDPPKITIIALFTKGATLTARLACRGIAGQRCAGTARLATFAKLAADGHTITGLTHGPSGRGRLIGIGSARYSITAGKKIKLQVKLNATGQSLLSRFGRVPATLKVTLSYNGYTIVAATAKITVNTTGAAGRPRDHEGRSHPPASGSTPVPSRLARQT